MILVTGSTGNVGSKLLTELLARKATVRALARKPEDVERLRVQGIEAVHGDITDRESIRAAMQGVMHVYILTPSTPQLAENESMLVDEAQKAGVQHIVKHSVLGPTWVPFVHLQASTHRLKKRYKRQGFPIPFCVSTPLCKTLSPPMQARLSHKEHFTNH